MSPALVPQLQVHLYNKFLELCGQTSKLWKDGIRVTLQNSNAEGLLEAQRDQMAINVAVRGSSSARLRRLPSPPAVERASLVQGGRVQPRLRYVCEDPQQEGTTTARRQRQHQAAISVLR